LLESAPIELAASSFTVKAGKTLRMY